MAKHKRFVVVEVKDTGIGIAPEYQSFIFQRFWRSNRVRSQQIKGSGLGLAIAQVIVQKYRGKITVSSQIVVGTCFQVHLPTV